MVFWLAPFAEPERRSHVGLFSGPPTENPECPEFVWNTAGLPTTAFHVYAVVTDDVSTSVFYYAPGAIRVATCSCVRK